MSILNYIILKMKELILILYHSNNIGILHYEYTGYFKKSFTTLKAYRNLYRGHTQGF